MWSNLSFWLKVAKTGQILTKKGPKSQMFEPKSDFHVASSANFCFQEMYFQKFCAFLLDSELQGVPKNVKALQC